MATPKGTRAQRFLLKSGDAIHAYSNAQAITLQLRREVPTEVDVSAPSFKASVVLTATDAIAVAGELLTAAAAQLKSSRPVGLLDGDGVVHNCIGTIIQRPPFLSQESVRSSELELLQQGHTAVALPIEFFWTSGLFGRSTEWRKIPKLA